MKTLDELKHLRENLAKQEPELETPWFHNLWRTIMALLDEAIEERDARLRHETQKFIDKYGPCNLSWKDPLYSAGLASIVGIVIGLIFGRLL